MGETGFNPGLGRSSGEGNGNPLQYSCLEIPMDREAWWAYSPWGHKESEMAEQLHSLTHLWIKKFYSFLSNVNTIYLFSLS